MPKTLPAVFVIPFITLAATAASAQGSNQGNPTILEEVRVLQTSVNGLASQLAAIAGVGGNVTAQLTAIANQLTANANQLTALTNTVNALAAPPTVVSTGFSYKPAGYAATCSVQNVGTSPVTVKVELVDIGGVVQQILANEALAAGRGGGFSQSVGSSGNFFWCRFSMVSGSSANIRASMDFIGDTTGAALISREAR